MEAKYWTSAHHEAVKKAQTFSELVLIAYNIIDDIPGPVALVSGPISSGGKGTIAENLKVFEKIITTLENRGEVLFNQLPFERKFAELRRGSKLQYFQPILDEFFLPLFKSGKISKIWFMHNWETSIGARWEYDMAQKLGIVTEFLN